MHRRRPGSDATNELQLKQVPFHAPVDCRFSLTGTVACCLALREFTSKIQSINELVS